MNNIILFTYGTLKPGFYHYPKNAKGYKLDSIKADMYDLKEYPAAINIGKSKNWIQGYSVEMPEEELPRYVYYEKPDFKLRKVKTYLGHIAFVFEYTKDIPKNAEKIDNWINKKRGNT